MAYLSRLLALAALIAAALPTLAHATVTESTVTSPATSTYRLHDPEVTLDEQTLAVAATTDGAARDEVDILCTSGSDAELLAAKVPVGDGGRLEVDVALAGFPAQLCDLRVVPSGLPRPGLLAVHGPGRRGDQLRPGALPRRDPRHEAPRHARLHRRHRPSAGRGQHPVGRWRRPVRRHRREGGSARALRYTTWRDGAELELEVDGRTAYTAAAIPLFTFDTGKAWAPAGFEGLQSASRSIRRPARSRSASRSGSSAASAPSPAARRRRTAARSSTPASGSSGRSA